MAPLTDSTRWLPLSQYDATARHRLFCLPFVGRGASFYRGWLRAFPEGVQVCPVQLPDAKGGCFKPYPP